MNTIHSEQVTTLGATYYKSSIEHVLAELERIDLLVQMQIHRARKQQKELGDWGGLYISEEEVDRLIKQPVGMPQWALGQDPSINQEAQVELKQLSVLITQCKANSIKRGIPLRLVKLTDIFNLNPREIDILLICLAPELDLRFERLYAYLQDDITKKKAGVDLMVNLLCNSIGQKMTMRACFSISSPLIKNHLVELFEDSSRQNTGLLDKYIKVDERVVNYLLDSDELDSRLLGFVRLIEARTQFNELLLPVNVSRHLKSITRTESFDDEKAIFYFQGKYGVGKQSTAEALCYDMEISLLIVNLEYLFSNSEFAFEAALQIILREALLQGSALFFQNFETLLTDDKKAALDIFVSELEKRKGITFLAAKTLWEPKDALRNKIFMRIEFPQPSYSERLKLWKISLKGKIAPDSRLVLGGVANKFRFSGGQIRDAVSTASNLARWRDPANGYIILADLYEACRLQSNRKLATLAQKITPRYTMLDIVLPPDPTRQLQEICNHVKYRSLVHVKWGFGKKMSIGRGLNVLFSGPSGTGKTMSAEIIAHEQKMDLYKIDLSTVVSKYIGETEKNLAHIFTEAETSNAILFFDEADALFGKRSEVRDAHDRYANLEIGYLLQKMEEYDGVVILATNLRKNMDDAFVRRMQFIVEFPFPDELYRYKIWKAHFPEEAPLAEDIDWQFLSEKFKFAGGNIKNVAVGAAFYGADESSIINMGHIILAAKRELQKQGKLCVKGDFGKYYELIESEAE